MKGRLPRQPTIGHGEAGYPSLRNMAPAFHRAQSPKSFWTSLCETATAHKDTIPTTEMEPDPGRGVCVIPHSFHPLFSSESEGAASINLAGSIFVTPSPHSPQKTPQKRPPPVEAELLVLDGGRLSGIPRLRAGSAESGARGCMRHGRCLRSGGCCFGPRSGDEPTQSLEGTPKTAANTKLSKDWMLPSLRLHLTNAPPSIGNSRWPT